MSSFSRNFIIHAVSFLDKNLDEKRSLPAEVISLLATSSSFMNGSFAPEMVMKNKPRLAVLQLLQNFSSTLQFVTSLQFSENHDSKYFLSCYHKLLSQQIHSTRYFTRQLVRLDIHTLGSSDTFTQCLPLLQGLRSFRCGVMFDSDKKGLKQEKDLVAGLENLDLDELKFKFWPCARIPSNIIAKIWKKNPMRRLRTFELELFGVGSGRTPKCELALSCISEFHPNLHRLLLFVDELVSVPDFSVMNNLEELALSGPAFGARAKIVGGRVMVAENMRDVSDFFLTAPQNGTSTYCNHLAKLHLDANFPIETLKFFIRRLGSSDVVKTFTLGGQYEDENQFIRPEVRFSPNDDRRSPSRKYSTHSSCDVEYLDLLIERYPLLHFLHLGECTCLTEKQLQMIRDNMSCLRALILPVEDEFIMDRIKPEAVLSTVRDLCTRNSNADPVFEYLLLPYNIKFGLQDVVSVFGTSPATSNLGLRRLHASYSLFDTIDSFRTFLSHFTDTLEFVSLPAIDSEKITRINNDDGSNNDKNSLDVGIDDEFPTMQNLREIYIDAEQLEKYSYATLAPMLVKASPRLQVVTLEYPKEHDPREDFCFGNYARGNRKDIRRDLTELFNAVGGIFNQETSARCRDFITIVLGNTIASLCCGETWTQLAQIKSLRRVLVSASEEENILEIFPDCARMIVTRPDIMTNFRFSDDARQKRRVKHETKEYFDDDEDEEDYFEEEEEEEVDEDFDDDYGSDYSVESN